VNRSASAKIAVMILLVMLGGTLVPSAGIGLEYHRAEGDGVTVFFPPSMKGAADEVIGRFPRLREAMAVRIGWVLGGWTAVWLVDDTRLFQRMIGRPYFAAFVLPDRSAVVIDATQMRAGALTLETTLKHELCHLLLHQHLPASHLPRWLDEGIAQWYSDGISELLNPGRGDALRRAAVAGGIPGLDQIDRLFSRDRASVALAYDASRSIVDYIVRHHGVGVLLRLLDGLKKDAPRAVFPAVLGRSLDDVEAGWQRSLENADAWWVMMSVYLYEILFFAAAVMTCAAFFRLILKKKRYAEAEDPEAGDES
jgi:hypothetical protein